MKSDAKTVASYLKSLPEERREIIAPLRNLIRRHLPKGYVESMNWGMIAYEVPLKAYPKTHNGQPLTYAALASQKNNCAVYLMNVYGDGKIAAAFKAAFKKAGKKLNMGKSCVRFKRLEDLHLPAIAGAIESTPVKEYIAQYEKARKKK